ncbi:hypothetical protein [Halomonas sp. CKK8]|uniref:hypothetical protein n=1 Tax=Halomonas sp. CKK8 TaxID=3036127 RepID=UPI00241508CD|nr:hypothetical protein [Halomonas sp. CKK8]WFM72970.1 hypothetical protein P8934_08230 [Halomonas sp. CKK8]
MAKDLPLWQSLPEYDPQAVNLDFSARDVVPYVAPYEAPSAGSVNLDFWGDYEPGEPLDLRLGFTATVYRYEPPGAGSVDLAFDGDYTIPGAGSVDLAFGGQAGDTPEPATPLTIDATLPSVGVYARFEVRNTLAIRVTMPRTQANIHLANDINVWRGPMAQAGDRTQRGVTSHAITAGRYGESDQRRRQVTNRYQQGAWRKSGTRQTSRGMADRHATRRVVSEKSARQGRQVVVDNRSLPFQGHRHRALAEQGQAVGTQRGALNHYLPSRRRLCGLPFEQASDILARQWNDTWQPGQWWPVGWRGPFEQTTQPPPGTSPLPPGPEEPEEPGFPPLPDFYRGSPDLNFCAPIPEAPYVLTFGEDPCAPLDPDAPIVAPIQRTYLVSNSASLTLVATGQALAASAISAAIDADSWAWELRATVHGAESVAAIRDATQPMEIEATLNGHTWRGVLDSWSRNRQFGEVPTITLSARSLAAFLAAPHAAPRSYTETQTRTAQQLAEQELPLGWTLDWQIDDWLVEPEAWHYTNRTPIEAITAIASAAGAVVQAHPSQPRLIIAPRYAAPHWAWGGATPDVTLPLDVLTRLGSEVRSSEALNGIYVSGETTGVLALVKRTGTAAGRLGEMVVDPLVTRQAPARGRGIAVLSASGAQTRESLALPLSADIAGLLETGQLVRVDPDGDDWRGLVRAVSLNAQLQGDALTIDQSVELERHLEEIA